MSGDVFPGKHGMRLIGSESEEQQGEPATGSGTVINGELVIGAGSSLVARGIVEIGPDSMLTIEDGGALTIEDDNAPSGPPAERRLMTRADAARLLAEHGHPGPPSPADLAAIRSMLDHGIGHLEPLSPADLAAIRSVTELGHLEPVSPAAVKHLLEWYMPVDRLADLQRRLALGEIDGTLAAITAGIDVHGIADSMVSVRGQLDQLARSATEFVQQMAAPVAISAAETLRQMMADSTLAAIAEQRAEFERSIGITGLGITGLGSSAERRAQLDALLQFGPSAEQRAEFERSIGITGLGSFATAGSGALLSQLAYSPLATAGSIARTYEETRRYGGAWAEPPAEQGRLEVVQVQPADWREVLTMAIKGGHASPKEVAAWLHGMAQQQGPGQKPADWADIEAVALMYKTRGSKYESQGAFVGYLARRGMAISVSTLQRWLAEYEQVTGERLRPGRGSPRRGSL